ncbi:Di-copper centre-containing protein [Lactarius quietus]|nr:Di-copper centre-containing protein [Lactarius quietus]
MFSTVQGLSFFEFNFHEKACTNPSVRREWRKLTAYEKAEWIRAVNCLSHLPHDTDLTTSMDPSVSLIPQINVSSSYYDDIVYIHMDLNNIIHFTGQFLPWHRMYLRFFEHALKKKCGYHGVTPYWDWRIDAPDFYDSPFWNGSNPESGLGGWGDPSEDFSVTNGGFSDLWLSYPSPHIVRRNFTLQPFELLPPPLLEFISDPQKEANTSFVASVIENILETPTGDFKGFQTALEAWEGPHSAVHLIVGGDLAGNCPENASSNCIPGPKWSPNDPLFFMHHAMIDKIWYDWQHRDPENAKSFSGGSTQALDNVASFTQYPNGGPPFLNFAYAGDGLFPEFKIGDVMDTTSGILCYVYE